MFSTRTSWELGDNDLAVKVRAARASGRALVDLTISNPTQCGFAYDAAALLAPLSDARALQYEPEPLGMLRAREGVVAYYGSHGCDVDAAHVCLTTSTSEAYSFLFRLLCDPGDEVLVAQPSYPLFEYIARLDDVVLREFPLHYDPGADARNDHGWSMDLQALRAGIAERTRAVIVVHPNNPTGNFVSDAEREALSEICAEHGLALIVDEVFLDYALTESVPASFAHGESKALTFVLSGLSKVCALPQMKASWIVARGSAAVVEETISRLEVIADTFLSMNAPVQFALPSWLALCGDIQQQIVARMKANLAALDARLRGTTAQRLAFEGGWTVVLRVPRHVEGVEFVEAALERGVLVQPGDFYGLPQGRVVMSLLTPEDAWARGLALLPID